MLLQGHFSQNDAPRSNHGDSFNSHCYYGMVVHYMNIPQIIYLSPFSEMWVTSRFVSQWIMLLWTFVYVFLGGYVIAFPWG